MKKYPLIIAFLVIALFLGGCGSKPKEITLKETIEEKGFEFSLDQIVANTYYDNFQIHLIIHNTGTEVIKTKDFVSYVMDYDNGYKFENTKFVQVGAFNISDDGKKDTYRIENVEVYDGARADPLEYIDYSVIINVSPEVFNSPKPTVLHLNFSNGSQYYYTLSADDLVDNN